MHFLNRKKCVDRTGDVEWPRFVNGNGGNKTIPFASVVHDDMPVAHENYQRYYVLTQKVYDFVLGYMSRNEELET